MVRNRTALLVALTTLATLIGPMTSSAQASATKEEIVEALRGTELANGSLDELSDKALSAVALLTKTVEAKRDAYARALELYIERIGAAKDVDSALIEYERAEISLAAEWKSTRKVLEIIKKQEKLAHEWKHYKTLHPEHRNAMEHHGSGHPSEAHHTTEHHSMAPSDRDVNLPQTISQARVGF